MKKKVVPRWDAEGRPWQPPTHFVVEHLDRHGRPPIECVFDSLDKALREIEVSVQHGAWLRIRPIWKNENN